MDQGNHIQQQIGEAKNKSNMMQEEKLQLKKQIRMSNQEAIFFQG